MFGVDKGDQIRMHGGGFARKAHFKKWYKKAFFAVADCMLLNSLIAWNLSCSHPTRNQRRRLLRHEFYFWVAEAMLTYKDPSLHIRSPEKIREATAGMIEEHTHVCTVADCDRIAHNGFLQSPRRIHTLEPFKGMTCFEILHSPIGHEVWNYKGKDRASVNAKPYSVNYSHPLVQDIRRLHGLVPQQQRRKKQRHAPDFRWNDQGDTESQSQGTTNPT